MAAPKQGIQLKQTQTLAVTPQMQQSLMVLQCNRQELEIEIARMLDENILLQRLDSDEGFQSAEEFSYDDFADTADDNVGEMPDDIPDIIDCDVAWEELYDDYNNFEDIQRGGDVDGYEGFQESWVADSQSFDERLQRSLLLCELSDKDKTTAIALLSHLDDNYFLSEPVDKLAKKLSVTPRCLADIIRVVKHLDPPGVASQNIQECLLAQLHSLPQFEEAVGNAHDILSDYFDYIGQKEDLIKQRLGLTDVLFAEAMQVIRSLSPYPRNDDDSGGRRIRPDVFVHQRMGVYYASLNQDNRFDIGLNETYAAMTEQCQGDEKRFMQAQLQTAKFFIRALDQRHQTILRVSNAIVIQQQDYFEQGEKALKPLLMKDLAELLNLAESTISRTVNGKYLSFNRRLIELRYFFSNELGKTEHSTDTDAVGSSATAVKALIKEMIADEPPRKPLTDSKIEKALKEQGIDIARRTVAKYRESMGIPATSKRKRRI